MPPIIRSFYNNKHKSASSDARGPEDLGAQGWAPGQSDAVLGIWIVAGAGEENNCGDLVVDRLDRPKT